VHVRSGGNYGKVWLGPPIELAEPHAYNPREARTVFEIVTREHAMMKQAWYDYFGT